LPFSLYVISAVITVVTLVLAMTTQYATSYDQTTTVTEYSTTQTTSSGVIDKLYIKSIPGILKLVEMVQDAFDI